MITASQINAVLDEILQTIEDAQENENLSNKEEKRPTLTEADALADLRGEPRPDNPSTEATALQEVAQETENYSSSNAIAQLIEGTLNNYLETAAFPTETEARILLMLQQLKKEL